MGEIYVSGFFGLIGVLVGAIITTGFSYWHVKRQEKAEAAKAAQARAKELKTAARLVAQ